MGNISQKAVKFLKPVFIHSLQEAQRRFESSIKNQINFTDLSVKEVSSKEMSYIFGSKQKIIAGVYMGYDGPPIKIENVEISSSGHFLLVFNIESAYEIVDLLTQKLKVPLEKISSIAESIIGEIGNMFTTGFLSSLADELDSRLLPTIPLVINYRVGSVIEYMIEKFKVKSDSYLTLYTSISHTGDLIKGGFIFVPEDYRSLLFLSQSKDAQGEQTQT